MSEPLLSKETTSTFFKRDDVNDWTVDLELGLEVDAYTPNASLQFTARRNVYSSADTVDVNLRHANGYINYDLKAEKTVLFNVNALTSQQIGDDLSLDLMVGAGADTASKKTVQL